MRIASGEDDNFASLKLDRLLADDIGEATASLSAVHGARVSPQKGFCAAVDTVSTRPPPCITESA
jgi:hypothetical protein